MTNTEKVAYIRGLAEGLELDDSKKEVKVLNAIIDLLDDLAMSLADLEDGYSDMADQLDAVDEDLGSLEDDFYGDDEDDEDDEDTCYYEVTCPNCHLPLRGYHRGRSDGLPELWRDAGVRHRRV